MQELTKKMEKFKDWGTYDTSNYVVKKKFKNGKHADLVYLLVNQTGDKIIKKRYHKKYLNIFYNEAENLYNLNDCDFVPKLLKVRPEKMTLYMSYCGEAIPKKELSKYSKIIRDLENTLIKNWNLYHNDIKPGNICIKNRKIYLIDFGWASNKELKAGYGKGKAGFQLF